LLDHELSDEHAVNLFQQTPFELAYEAGLTSVCEEFRKKH
jgi:hypothetical protein